MQIKDNETIILQDTIIASGFEKVSLKGRKRRVWIPDKARPAYVEPCPTTSSVTELHTVKITNGNARSQKNEIEKKKGRRETKGVKERTEKKQWTHRTGRPKEQKTTVTEQKVFGRTRDHSYWTMNG